MLGTMLHKGLVGSVQYSKTDSCFWGEILGTTDLYLYEGDTFEELRKDFEEFVDDYLEMCAEEGKNPPYVGMLQKPLVMA